MTMTRERQRANPLHEFNLPDRLRWGVQRRLRCQKSDGSRSEDVVRKTDGTEAFGGELMLDFKRKLDGMKVMVRMSDEDTNSEEKDVAVKRSVRPWNLRVRRSPPAWAVEDVVVLEKKRRVVLSERYSPKEVGKLRIGLERWEIEKDFLAMGGTKLPRRPKRRPRIVQKDLNTLFPGLHLIETEMTLESYAVHKAPAS